MTMISHAAAENAAGELRCPLLATTGRSVKVPPPGGAET